MMRLAKHPERDEWYQFLARPADNNAKIEKVVKPILDRVKRGGDKALKKLAEEFDHVDLDSLLVSEEEIKAATDHVPEQLKQAILLAKNNIEQFHLAQVEEEISLEIMPGVQCSRKSIPIQKVGLYIPGGTAPLFSTVLMLAIPARIAGCQEIVVCTPTDTLGNVNPIVLYAANLLGVTKILKLGGAQAIGALAYGSESVPKVDKIFGPGNQYVTVAKQLVMNDGVAIDMPAGPSEVAVFVDKHSNPSFAAADLLSQAEHGMDSQVLLISSSKKMAKLVLDEVEQQLVELPRKEIASLALENSWAIVVENKSEGVELINEYAPEHLILSVENADEIADKIVNAGSVFIGEYTPESAGDYASGTNHTLPTSGWAKSMAGVSVDSFVKKITYQRITSEGLQTIGPAIEIMAEHERLDGHKNAVSVRLRSIENARLEETAETAPEQS